MRLRFFAFLLSLLTIVSINGQEVPCEPDTTVIDGRGAIFPRPFIPDDTLNIGIQKVACINEPFEFNFTIVIPNSVSLGAIDLVLTGARADTVGAVDSLPLGLDYSCNPISCEYDTLVPGCLFISGIPSVENDTGIYNLSLNFSLVSLIGSFPTAFPSAQFPGNYFLRLLPEGSPECDQVLATKYANKPNVQMYNAPNPFMDVTTLYLHLEEADDMRLSIADFSGKILREVSLRLNPGLNTLPLQNLDLPNGIYTYTLHNHKTSVSKKMMVLK